MKIIADEDMYISSTWGSSIRLYAGQVKEVGDDMGLLALQEGARRIEDGPKLNNPSLIAREEEVVEEAEIIEDSIVVDLNDGGDREEKLKAAMQQILDENSPKDFTADGLPKQSVIKNVFGEQISSDERDELWAEMILNKEEE
jgi:hypothetical protein|tara:strand:- start:4992 stop:5420 length:429 start_codon:yes stop_codon:yes gene_type:complete